MNKITYITLTDTVPDISNMDNNDNKKGEKFSADAVLVSSFTGENGNEVMRLQMFYKGDVVGCLYGGYAEQMMSAMLIAKAHGESKVSAAFKKNEMILTF